MPSLRRAAPPAGGVVPPSQGAKAHDEPLETLNYLAHIYLAERTPESIYGNLLGDFIKGNPPATLSGAVVKGIEQHRQIDKFTDDHATTRASRARIEGELRRFAGIIVDLSYDHFLSRHWSRFAHQPLPEFIRHTYTLMAQEPQGLDEAQLHPFRRMREEDWLSPYATIAGIEQAGLRIAARVRRPTPLGRAAQALVAHYEPLEQDFLTFFPQLIDFARHQLQMVAGDHCWPAR